MSLVQQREPLQQLLIGRKFFEDPGLVFSGKKKIAQDKTAKLLVGGDGPRQAGDVLKSRPAVGFRELRFVDDQIVGCPVSHIVGGELIEEAVDPVLLGGVVRARSGDVGLKSRRASKCREHGGPGLGRRKGGGTRHQYGLVDPRKDR